MVTLLSSFFHLKETQREERLRVVQAERCSQRLVPPSPKTKAITTSHQKFQSRLICIINTIISLNSALTIRGACKGSMSRAELHPKAKQVPTRLPLDPQGDVPRSPTRSHGSLAEPGLTSCFVSTESECSPSLACPDTLPVPRAVIIAVRFDFALKMHFNQTLLD